MVNRNRTITQGTATMLIGAAYLRCSDPRQDKSVDQQREVILQRAAQDGVHIPPENWFVDEGISGRSARKRRSYQRMIRCAESQRDRRRSRRRRPAQREPIDRLYVWAFSRLARNMTDCLRALAVLEEADIEVISLTEQDGQDRSIRKLIRPILAWLAERYSEELSHTVQRGMRSQAEKGLWVYGRPPFGYEVEDGRLVVTERTRPQLEVVQRVFQLADDSGDGATRIAAALTREGVAPPSRQDVERRVAPGAWRAKHVAGILKNPVYAGHSVNAGKIVARDTHEAAVDDSIIDRIQAQRALRDRNRKAGKGNGANRIRNGDRGLLTPWLRCDTCGGAVCVSPGGSAKNRTYLYYCSTRQKNPEACAGISVRADKLDRLVLDAIEERVLTPENVRTLVADTIAQLGETPDEALAAQRAQLQDRIGDLDATIRRTAAQVINGLIDEDDAKVLNAPPLAQREQARLELAALPSQRVLPSPDEIDPERFRAEVLRAWREAPLEDRREALGKLLSEVRLSPGGVTIRYGLGGYHIHDPYGPPYAPMSLRDPSGSS